MTVHPEQKQIISTETPYDREYQRFFGLLSNTAGLIKQYGFCDGKDVLETPNDLEHALDMLKATTWEMYETKGKDYTFALIKRAKERLFEKKDIRNLDAGQRKQVEDVLRWHLQDAIDNPPPLTKRK